MNIKHNNSIEFWWHKDFPLTGVQIICCPDERYRYANIKKCIKKHYWNSAHIIRIIPVQGCQPSNELNQQFFSVPISPPRRLPLPSSSNNHENVVGGYSGQCSIYNKRNLLIHGLNRKPDHHRLDGGIAFRAYSRLPENPQRQSPRNLRDYFFSQALSVLQPQSPWGRNKSAIRINVLAPKRRCEVQVWIPHRLTLERVAVNFKTTAMITIATPNNPTIFPAQAHLHFIG